MSLASADQNPLGSRRSWNWAFLLGLIALIFGLLLAGLSAWFLGAVAIAGLSAAALTFNFHIPAALIRLFALGRTAAKYGERVNGHRAALLDQAIRRAKLFSAMALAPAALASGWQLGREDQLANYLDDVEDLDYARLRVSLPLGTLAFGLAACLMATLVLAPLAILGAAIPLAMLAGLLVGCSRAMTGALRQARDAQAQGATSLGAALSASAALQAEGNWRSICRAAMATFDRGDQAIQLARRAEAAISLLAGLTGPLAAASLVASAWIAGQRSEGLLPAIFVAFAWLAMGEALLGVSKIQVARLRRRAAADRLQDWPAQAPAAARRAPGVCFATLRLEQLERRAPDGRNLGEPISLTLEAGRPTFVSGPSGGGKTSLLKQIAGWIGTDVMTADGIRLAPEQRQTLTHFCPHDAVVLTDTVRANLFAPGKTDGDLWQALDAMELSDRIAQAGGLDAWISPDHFSLGEAQRLSLARAWLSDQPLVILDEPAEHLAGAQGQRLQARLLHHIHDRIVVVSSHLEAESTYGRAELRLQ